MRRSKDYQKLVDGRKYAMKYRDAVASLVVQDVVDRDRGLYTCEASNVHGYATSSAALRLKGNDNTCRWPRRYALVQWSIFVAHIGLYAESI